MQTRQDTVGQLAVSPRNYDQLVGTVDVRVLDRLSGLVRECEQPRHELDISCRVARAEKLRHSVEAGVMMQAWGVAVGQDATTW